ncbi:ABC-type amino acid transport substrate-binding protein [Alteromonadaceae bacterium 2753L.S.0a.02]|nr:ABC-type amino acid transport substrate-binding protein [Alteromonadaceae bacterium 2753L.S.0a.02]
MVGAIISFMAFNTNAIPLGDKLVTIATYESPPYQVTAEPTLSGSSVGALRCVLDNLGRPYKIVVYPQKRAFQSLRAGRVDALLSVTPEQVNHVDLFTLSQPIALEKWVIFSHAVQGDLVSDVGANYFGSLGVILGSPQENWLEQRNYPIKSRVLDMQILLNMFAMNRFDSVLVDLHQARRDEYQPSEGKLSHSYLHFVKYSPKSVAFSKPFAANNAQFISEFNNTISGCLPVSMRLDSAEREHLIFEGSHFFNSIQEDASVRQQVQQQNQSPPLQSADIDTLEYAWRWGAHQKSIQHLFSGVVQSQAALNLISLKERSRGVIREIIVTDKLGFNAVVTDKTSDFYQGDESKFSEVVQHTPVQVYASPIQYDASTARFLVHVSFPLFGRGDKVIGVAILGIDPEIALANRHLWGSDSNPATGFAVGK